jgi:hypothetical protein
MFMLQITSRIKIKQNKQMQHIHGLGSLDRKVLLLHLKHSPRQHVVPLHALAKSSAEKMNSYDSKHDYDKRNKIAPAYKCGHGHQSSQCAVQHVAHMRSPHNVGDIPALVVIDRAAGLHSHDHNEMNAQNKALKGDILIFIPTTLKCTFHQGSRTCPKRMYTKTTRSHSGLRTV